MPLLLQDSTTEQPASENAGNGDSYYRGERMESNPVLNPVQFGQNVTPQGILGIDYNADAKEIKFAYRAKAKQLGDPNPDNQLEWQQLNWANDVFSNDQLRAEYDRYTAANIRNNTEGQRASRVEKPLRQDRMHQYGPYGGEIPKYGSIFDYTHLFRGIPIAEMDNQGIEVHALQQRLDSLHPSQKKLVMNLVIIVSAINKNYPDSGIELNVEMMEKIISYAEAWEPALMHGCGVALSRS